MPATDAAAAAGIGANALGAIGTLKATTDASIAMQTVAGYESAKKDMNATVMTGVNEVSKNAKNLIRTS